MSVQTYILAQNAPPRPGSPPAPPRLAPGSITAPPTPQQTTPLTSKPAPPAADTSTTPATTRLPPNPPTYIWVVRRDNTDVGIALGLLLVVVVLGWFVRGWVMQMAARRGVDPLRAGGFGSVVWLTLVAIAAIFVTGFLYQVFLLTEFLIGAGLALAICLLLLWLTSRSLRRRRA